MNDDLIGTALTYRIGGRTALDGIDIAAGPGDLLAVRGPSGSGKSTLLAILAGLLEPAAGDVRFAGRAWRRHAGPAASRPCCRTTDWSLR